MNDIDSAQLIDNLSLQKNGCFDDKECSEYILEVLAELKQYDKSMVVFNLDRLSGVSISQSDSMGKSLSYSISSHKMYDNIKSLAETEASVFYQDNKGDKKGLTIKKGLFVVITVSSKYLLDLLVESLGPEQFTEFKERERKEQEDQNKERLCLRCGKTFIKKDNKTESCTHHSVYVYNSIDDKRDWYTINSHEDKERVIWFQGQEDLKINEGDDDKEKDDKPDDKNPHNYFCCGQQYQPSGGCRNKKHIDNLDEFKKEWSRDKKDFDKRIAGFQ